MVLLRLASKEDGTTIVNVMMGDGCGSLAISESTRLAFKMLV